MPADEQPDPIVPAAAPLARREDGTIASSEAAKELGRRGAEAKASKKRLLQGLGLFQPPDGHVMKPYYDAVSAWMLAQLAETCLAAGGYIGPGPSSMIGSAGIALAQARYFADLFAADPTNAELSTKSSRLSECSRQHLLAAHEIAIREGKARIENKKQYVSLEEIAELAEQD